MVFPHRSDIADQIQIWPTTLLGVACSLRFLSVLFFCVSLDILGYKSSQCRFEIQNRKQVVASKKRTTTELNYN